MTNTIHSRLKLNAILLFLFFVIYPAHSEVENFIPKLVYLIFDEDRVIASNIETSRFDEVRLVAKEEVVESAVGKAVIVVTTNKRLLAYSVKSSAWVSKEVIPNERLESLDAEDYSAMVITSKRFLNFNGKTGIWSEKSRRKVFN